MKSAVISSAVFAAIVSLWSAHAAPLSAVQVERRDTVRYVSPATAVVENWISTANITQDSVDYASSLLELDLNIESFYLGDGTDEPLGAYDPYVTLNKNGIAEVIAASGTASAASADVTLQKNWAQLSTVAYCDTSAISAWSCATCSTNSYGKPSSIVTVDQNNARFYAGYIASTNTIFVSFRGSANLANWLTNLDFALDSYRISGVAPSGARFHSGFQELYSALSGTVRSVVSTLATTYPTASIAFTGHSMGGSLAVHAALDLVATGYVSRLTASKITLFTQGEPRLGNNAAGVWVTARGWAGSYRGVNYDDLVPHLPYQWMGYRHHRREWWILSGGSSVVTCNDVNASDNEDTDCLNSIWFTSTSAHGVYFTVPMGSGC